MTEEEHIKFLREFTPTDDAYNVARYLADHEQACNKLYRLCSGIEIGLFSFVGLLAWRLGKTIRRSGNIC